MAFRAQLPSPAHFALGGANLNRGPTTPAIQPHERCVERGDSAVGVRRTDLRSPGGRPSTAHHPTVPWSTQAKLLDGLSALGSDGHLAPARPRLKPTLRHPHFILTGRHSAMTNC